MRTRRHKVLLILSGRLHPIYVTDICQIAIIDFPDIVRKHAVNEETGPHKHHHQRQAKYCTELLSSRVHGKNKPRYEKRVHDER